MKDYIRMLFKDSDQPGLRYFSGPRLLALGLSTALTSLALPSAQAASATWIGASTTAPDSLNDGANWSSGSATFASSDIVTFDDTTALGVTLVWSAQFGPSYGATDGTHIVYSGAGNLTLDSNPSSAFFGLGNITINSGAGVFTIGDGGTDTTLVFRGSGDQDTFANNSANPAVFASDVRWRAGGGAAKTVTFDGSGDWHVQSAFRIDASQGQSGLTLVKNGSGTLDLSAADNFGSSAGGLTLNQGTLSVSGVGAFGLNATYAQPVALNGGSLLWGSTAAQTFSGVVSGSAPITLSAGKVTLSGTSNTYSGAVTVGGGTFALSGDGTLNSASSFVVNGSGATLTNNSTQGLNVAVSLRSGGLTGSSFFETVTVPNNSGNAVSLGATGAENVSINNLTFQGATSLTITKVAASPSNASVTVFSTLATTPANGKIRLNVSLPFWTSGQFYVLIQAGVFGGNASDFQIGTISGLTSRQSASVVVQGNSIGLMINGDTPRWSGAGDAIWNTTSTGNWKLIIGGGDTLFVNGDVVQFDDTASNPSVSIGAAGVQPASTQFSNDSLSYTLAGPGGIAAGSLIKNGVGQLTISSPNTYTGGTTINSGTLTLSGAGTLGGSSAAVTINGGTLDLGGTSQTLGVVSAAGDSYVSNGELSPTTLMGTGTSGVSNISATVHGAGAVVMNGAGGTMTLSATNDYTGGTTVSAGTLALAYSGTLGDASAAVTVAGGVLDLGGTTQTVGGLALSGPGTVQNGTLDGVPVTSSLSSGKAVVSATLTGSSSVTSTVAGGVLAFTGENTYTGATTATLGTIQLGDGEDIGSLSPDSPITVGTGAVFAVNRVIATTQGVEFGTISGGGGFTQSGFGATTLNVANNYTGTTNITSGTLAVTADGAVGTGAVNINGYGNRLNLSGDITLGNAINTGGGAVVQNVSGNNTLTGPFQFAYVGNVATTITSAADTLTLAGDLTISSSLSWTTANRTFAFTGAGNTVVSGGIHNSSFALIGVSKDGAGVLTLSGVNDYTSTTFSYGGVLRVDGALATNATTGTASAVTTEIDGTLAGTGSIAGPTEIYGTLRPSAGGTAGGSLRFDNSLYLDFFARTQFDIEGAVFTGVTCTQDSGLTYGGTLKVNIPAAIYNGSYTLFAMTGSPSGAFDQMTLTTATDTDVPFTLNNTVWSLVSGGVSYSFDQATGVLTITGAADPVVPGSTTLSAVAGDSLVNLSWTVATGADTYVLLRSTTPGGPYDTIASGLTTLSYIDTDVANDTTYYYVVMGQNADSGLTGAASTEVSATPQMGELHSALQLWRFETFGVYDDDDSVLAGDAEDYDGDGMSNLLEYALGTDPTVPNTSPVTVTVQGNVLKLTYTRRTPADTSIVYQVEASNDLSAFTAANGTTDTVDSVSTYTDTVNLSAGNVRRFLRLTVSYTP